MLQYFGQNAIHTRWEDVVDGLGFGGSAEGAQTRGSMGCSLPRVWKCRSPRQGGDLVAAPTMTALVPLSIHRWAGAATNRPCRPLKKKGHTEDEGHRGWNTEWHAAPPSSSAKQSSVCVRHGAGMGF